MTGALVEISEQKGAALLEAVSVSWEVPDLETIEICSRETGPLLPGKRLAADLRMFAKGVKDAADASAAAIRIARWLELMYGHPERSRDWKDLATLAFWAVRNATLAWNLDVGGLALRDAPVRWFYRLQERKEVPGSGLKLKIHPLINLVHGRTVIIAPRWFLDTRALTADIGKDSVDLWRPVARAAADDYLRLAVNSESEVPAKRTTNVHPAVKSYLETMKVRRDSAGRLQFDGYIRDNESRADEGRAGNTPNVLISKMLDSMKNMFDALPDSAFVPWKQTMLGVLPSEIFD